MAICQKCGVAFTVTGNELTLCPSCAQERAIDTPFSYNPVSGIEGSEEPRLSDERRGALGSTNTCPLVSNDSPNQVWSGRQIFSTAMALFMVGYGLVGLMRNDFVLRGRRGPAVHFHGVSALLMFFATALIAAAVFDSAWERDDKRTTNRSWRPPAFVYGIAAFCCVVLAALASEPRGVKQIEQPTLELQVGGIYAWEVRGRYALAKILVGDPKSAFIRVWSYDGTYYPLPREIDTSTMARFSEDKFFRKTEFYDLEPVLVKVEPLTDQERARINPTNR